MSPNPKLNGNLTGKNGVGTIIVIYCTILDQVLIPKHVFNICCLNLYFPGFNSMLMQYSNLAITLWRFLII